MNNPNVAPQPTRTEFEAACKAIDEVRKDTRRTVVAYTMLALGAIAFSYVIEPTNPRLAHAERTVAFLVSVTRSSFAALALILEKAGTHMKTIRQYWPAHATIDTEAALRAQGIHPPPLKVNLSDGP